MQEEGGHYVCFIISDISCHSACHSAAMKAQAFTVTACSFLYLLCIWRGESEYFHHHDLDHSLMWPPFPTLHVLFYVLTLLFLCLLNCLFPKITPGHFKSWLLGHLFSLWYCTFGVLVILITRIPYLCLRTCLFSSWIPVPRGLEDVGRLQIGQRIENFCTSNSCVLSFLFFFF